MVEVGADQAGEFSKAGLVNRRQSVRQISALAPIGQRVRVIEPGCTLPEQLVVVQEGDQCPLEMVGERRELFDEPRARVGAGRQVPLRLVDDRPKALLAAQLEERETQRPLRCADRQAGAATPQTTRPAGSPSSPWSPDRRTSPAPESSEQAGHSASAGRTPWVENVGPCFPSLASRRN